MTHLDGEEEEVRTTTEDEQTNQRILLRCPNLQSEEKCEYCRQLLLSFIHSSLEDDDDDDETMTNTSDEDEHPPADRY